LIIDLYFKGVYPVKRTNWCVKLALLMNPDCSQTSFTGKYPFINSLQAWLILISFKNKEKVLDVRALKYRQKAVSVKFATYATSQSLIPDLNFSRMKLIILSIRSLSPKSLSIKVKFLLNISIFSVILILFNRTIRSTIASTPSF